MGINLTAICIADGFGIMLSLVMLGAKFWKTYDNKTEQRNIQIMLWTVLSACVSDVITFVLDGKPGLWIGIITYTFNFILFFANIVLGTMWMSVLTKHICGEKLPKSQKILTIVLDAVGVIALITNFFVPVVFKIDATNTYARGPLYYLFVGIEFFFILDGTIVYLVTRKKNPKTKYFPVLQYFVPIAIGAVVQTFIYGVSTIWPGISIAVCGIIFGIFNQNEAEKEALRQSESIINKLSHYEYACYIDCDGNEITKSYSSERVDAVIKSFDASLPKNLIFDKLINTIILPDERDGFVKSVNREDATAEIAEKGELVRDFHAKLDGEYKWYRLKMSPDRDSSGGIILGFVCIDEEKRAQEVLAEAYRKAEAESEAKSAFLFNMSHDIRTPMNAIMGFNNIALRNIGINDNKAKDSLKKTEKASGTLLNLINDVLEMSRIESGKIEITEEEGDVLHSFDVIGPMMKKLADDKQIDLSFTFGEIKNSHLIYDVPHTERILTNLVSNAIKYTEAGGMVTVFCEQVNGTEKDKNYFRYTVMDNGIGMSEEFQKHLFEQFSRERNSTVSKIQGTGLGLALSKSLSDAMGGEITCVSRQGSGTTFTFTIHGTPVDNSMAYANEEKTVSEAEFADKRVLLVEDNELNREIATELLEDSRFIVDTAEDGSVAVELLREKGPHYYDVILMDIQMPIMDGYEATREIREIYPDVHIPIIALSANAFEEDRKKSMESGMDSHVAKPINVSELKKTMSIYM